MWLSTEKPTMATRSAHARDDKSLRKLKIVKVLKHEFNQTERARQCMSNSVLIYVLFVIHRITK